MSFLKAMSACALTVLLSAPAGAELIWHWEDRFTATEKAKLTAWVEETAAAVEDFVMPYPFDVHIHFHRSSSSRPVPWANTIRSRRQGVNFHVNPQTSRRTLRADWTAYHELSHLLIPYLGRSHSWFAEGFASYMQYQVMHSLGVLSEEEMESKYRERIERAKRRYDMEEMPFVKAAPMLRQRRQYPTMYWGGAVYFLRVDQNLNEVGTSVPEVIREYVACCRVNRLRRLDDLVAELDRISGSDAFSRELEYVRTRPGFPDNSEIWTDEGSSSSPPSGW